MCSLGDPPPTPPSLVSGEDPGPPTPPPATPSALYRSGFAVECEAIARQLGQAVAGRASAGRPPWSALSVEDEVLTPLEPPYSFAEQTPARPRERQPSGEPGGGGNTAEGEEEAADPRQQRRDCTYDEEPCAAESALDATYLCDDASSGHRNRTYDEQEPLLLSTGEPPPATPLFASTPLLPGSAGRPGRGPAVSGPRGRPPRRGLSLIGRRGLAGASALLRPEGGGGKNAETESLRGQGQKTKRILSTVKKEPFAQPSSKFTRQSVGGKTLTCLELDQHRVSGENKLPGTRLPILAGHTKKPAGGVLLAPGQIPYSAPGSGSRVACAQCQRLREENERLKRMLEDCRRTITVLKKKGCNTASSGEALPQQNKFKEAIPFHP